MQNSNESNYCMRMAHIQIISFIQLPKTMYDTGFTTHDIKIIKQNHS